MAAPTPAPPPIRRRTIAAIDYDLRIERAVWLMERRAGLTAATVAALARLDRLLDERLTVSARHRRVTSPSQPLEGKA